MSTSIAQLKVVQTKYVEAKDCLNVLKKSNEGTGWRVRAPGDPGGNGPLGRVWQPHEPPHAAHGELSCSRRLSRFFSLSVDTEPCWSSLPVTSSRGSGQPAPAVRLHYFHRKRTTGPTDEFCILSTGNATSPPSSVFPKSRDRVLITVTP